MPIHKAALNGNPTCLRWIFETWEKNDIPLDVDTPDHQGLSALYLVCYKGYNGAEGIASANDPQLVMTKRMECVRILLEMNANVNYSTPKLGMTPLHWASYQGDAMMVNLLL